MLIRILADSSCNGVGTNLLGCAEGEGIGSIIKLVINIMFAGIVVAGTIGIIIVGARIMTARDNVAQVEKAKTRVAEIVIGLIAATVLWLVVPLVLPNVDESGINKTLAELDKTTKHVDPPAPDPTKPTTPTKQAV